MRRILVVLILARCIAGATYYIAASGNDSNPGTKAEPWAHAPGMPNCGGDVGTAGTCANIQAAMGSATSTNGAGTSFIFKGGDTWHFGDSGATPYVGGTWNPIWNGTAGNEIYWGVDATWYTGGAWSRPILTGDNPTSLTAVESCDHQVGASTNIMLSAGSYTTHNTFDNFEMTGLCFQTENAPANYDGYIYTGSQYENSFLNIYIHGWTHLAWSCALGNIGMCFDAFAVQGSGADWDGEKFYRLVIDGSDSDPEGLLSFYGGGYDISQSVIRYAIGLLPRNTHTIHDNLFEYLPKQTDGQAHSNVMAAQSESGAGDANVIYNNVFRHLCPESLGCTQLQGIQTQPAVGRSTYFFNNVYFDEQGVSNFEIGATAHDKNIGTSVFFSNTIEVVDNGVYGFLCNVAYASPITANNNLYIYDAGTYHTDLTGCLNPGPFNFGAQELLKTHAQAAADMNGASATYPYSPLSAESFTVGTGANLKATYCDVLSASTDALLQAAGTACLSDTTYGPAYDATNHKVTGLVRPPVSRPTSAAWDVGAYQLNPGAPTYNTRTTGYSVLSGGAQ